MSIKIKNEAARATIYIYGAIGHDFWDPESETTAKELSQTLDNLSPKPIDLRIDSCGGDVYEGFAIASAIQRYEGDTVAYIDGIAASAASYVALSADRVIMCDFAWLMVHNAWTYCSGNREDLRAMANQLEGVDRSIAKIITARSSLTYQEVMDAMASETWYTAEDAKEAGMCDEVVVTEERIAACIDEKLAACFHNIPMAIAEASSSVDNTQETPVQDDVRTAEPVISHTLVNIEDTTSAAPAEAFVLGNRVYTRKEK